MHYIFYGSPDSSTRCAYIYYFAFDVIKTIDTRRSFDISVTFMVGRLIMMAIAMIDVLVMSLANLILLPDVLQVLLW